MAHDRVLMWFRRDLRVEDNAALHAALLAGRAVFCVFVFDTDILGALPRREDRRVEFIHDAVVAMRADLEALGGGLMVRHGRPVEEIPALARALGAGAVYASRDYEPSAVLRDAAVGAALDVAGIGLRLRKDQAIFDTDEVLTGDGRPYSVYTPYRNAWFRRLETDAAFYLKPYPVARHAARLAPPPAALRAATPSLESLGFARTNLRALGIAAGSAAAEALIDDFRSRIDRYREWRDFPAAKGPSYLSVHLRFGTVSIRRLAALARAQGGEGAHTWLSELVWRDFYFAILHHHPRVADGAFRPDCDAIAFPNDPARHAAWCEARTGYPIVDAAMRQINATGYMHNRLRMIVASFLVKDLHCDWRLGERYFAAHLNDFDLAANNGGWQWAASTGCDAQPWFRIFNPVTQSERFDPRGRFIRKYLPELASVDDRHVHAPWTMDEAAQRAAGCIIGRDYPAPIVDHAEARKVALDLFGKVRRKAEG